MKRAGLVLLTCISLSAETAAADANGFAPVAPILEQNCVRCHQGPEAGGGLDLTRRETLLKGGESGASVVPGKLIDSFLLDFVEGDDPLMPKTGEPLTAGQIAALRQWIQQGADWPEGLVLEERQPLSWAMRPLVRPEPPPLAQEDRAWVRTPVDVFILAKLREQGLSPSPEADRRTLIRRLTFDLHGLPPTPEEIETFLADDDPRAYERLVDRLLESPRYGERWARHWLDVVQYGDTHGYDKDKLRPHAWPYRDYVIRSLNDDKPYSRFVKEQLAGDQPFPDSPDGVVATGFIAAGPWDFVGHVELREGTLDKQIARNLDRDNMVSAAMNTFTSLTVQCARCHDHKFDPISQEDYYSLQAVFAAVDRADRPYESDPAVARRRGELVQRHNELSARLEEIDRRIAELAGPELARIDRRIDELEQQRRGDERPEFGWHSRISGRQDDTKWVQVDLGRSTPIEHVVSVGCHDTFNNIGAGFGFPLRYRIEISDDPDFKTGVTVIEDRTAADVSNPGVRPQSVAAGGKTARYVRITATKLAPRQNDYTFALAELCVFTPGGTNVAAGAAVTSLDSIEAPPRWSRQNLTDGYYYRIQGTEHLAEVIELNEQRRELRERTLDPQLVRERGQVEKMLQDINSQQEALPPKSLVYAAATEFAPMGAFRPTGGRPRPIHLLHRGSEKEPRQQVAPGTVSFLDDLTARFDLGEEHHESQRRAALAEWIVDVRNPLTWRSIVNRVWHYHFGRGIAETPNDFGRMGSRPTHPELLDWLAVEFRDGGQSLKRLHRLIVTSTVYRQSSAHHEEHARTDAGNRFLWRMNRQRLEAEALRDAVLAVSGRLDLTMYGPGYKAFGFQDDHSPHYKYHEYDPDDPASHRRSVYRFIVRSVPDPFLETLDCADPSQSVARRNETLTALQALTLMNNAFMVRMSKHFAARVESMGDNLPDQITAAWRLALGRRPTPDELETLVSLAEHHGLANVCRLVFNANEFVFVD